MYLLELFSVCHLSGFLDWENKSRQQNKLIAKSIIDASTVWEVKSFSLLKSLS
jgi:hypothetical protein